MKNLFFIFLFISIQLYAQSSKNIDSLFLVNDYLQEIKTVVNSKDDNDKKIKELDNLIRIATRQKSVFSRNIKLVVKNQKTQDELGVSINFILQSLVLYETDIKSSSKSASERKYLNQNIPPLIDNILYHCKRFEENVKFETH